ncbi:hypothetical protein DRJ04_07390 [Candidatus Aerophobetes bacterium]|uniref:Uncharacterized protein n=1 Tax=Aerophobetes bacterium TaxID=2030807 RepID=A0A662DBS7_UNCAE|nr:MAG: hypothetical protein DRJ04_07390 [Candidatus Aerophobetes bacterium]
MDENRLYQINCHPGKVYPTYSKNHLTFSPHFISLWTILCVSAFFAQKSIDGFAGFLSNT